MSEPTVDETFRLVKRIRACDGEAAGVALLAGWLRAALSDQAPAPPEGRDPEATFADAPGSHLVERGDAGATSIPAVPDSTLDLLHTFDAKVWAGEFCRLHGGDEGLMLTWFANAMMTGYDEGRRVR